MSSFEEGHLLGRYRVEAFLAQGGMGRVYRAIDTVLGRRVALKVLAGDQPPDSPAVARLLREARAAAALSHPNICSVFDVGEVDGLPFIAMELVLGTSLRALLTDPATGLDQRLRWVHDLALALAAAHRAHVVHRDIKPDNVMVASDGRVRLLDFGVAKWDGAGVEPGPPGPEASGFRTADGQIVGTTGYMAPEQATGGQVDARTDQFAWGVVAYETLSGRHPDGNGGFGEPALLSSLVPTLPFGVAAIVAKALALEPSLRFADMDEIVALLQPLVAAAHALPPPQPPPAERFDGATASLTSTQAPGEPARRPSGDRRARTTARAIVLAAVIGGGAAAMVIGVARWRGPAAPRPTIELRVEHIRRITFGDRCEEHPTFTPDGRAVIYDGDDGRGNYVVYRLDLDEGATPRVLVHQDDPGWDLAPALSPTGDRVAFIHRGRQHAAVMVASLDGKEPVRAVGSSTLAPGWSADGRAIWASRNGMVGLYHMLTDHPGDTAPCFRKTGDAVVFTRHDAGGTRQVMVVPVSGGPPAALLGRGTHGAAISPVDDTIVYLADGRPPVVADAHGADERPLSPALSSDDFTDLRFSPDGTRVALLRANQELVEVEVARGAIVRTISAGPSEGLYEPFYGPAGLSVVRVRWQGNLFVADATFLLPDRSR